MAKLVLGILHPLSALTSRGTAYTGNGESWEGVEGRHLPFFNQPTYGRSLTRPSYAQKGITKERDEDCLMFYSFEHTNDVVGILQNATRIKGSLSSAQISDRLNKQGSVC